jgi:hypothetical protein
LAVSWLNSVWQCPQGILVRLEEDNTTGHVARVLAPQYRQRLEQWPDLAAATNAQGEAWATWQLRPCVRSSVALYFSQSPSFPMFILSPGF